LRQALSVAGAPLAYRAPLGERRSFTRATIQIPGIFTTISAVDFRRAASNNGLIRDLASRYTEVLWAETQQTAACNAIHDGRQRLCRWLLLSADCVGSDHLPLTLLAQELQERGAIRYSRGRIMILDRKALEACGINELGAVDIGQCFMVAQMKIVHRHRLLRFFRGA